MTIHVHRGREFYTLMQDARPNSFADLYPNAFITRTNAEKLPLKYPFLSHNLMRPNHLGSGDNMSYNDASN